MRARGWGPRGPWCVATLVGLAIAGAWAGCNRKTAPDAGVGAEPRGESGSQATPTGAPLLRGPNTTPEGPRVAPVAEAHRVADVASLRKHKELAGAAPFVEEAVRDVYGDAALRARIEKASGEPLRPPSSIVLERLDVGGPPGVTHAPALWRVTYEAWCGKSTEGSAGYKSDHLLLSRASERMLLSRGGAQKDAEPWRLVQAYRPGCDESGEPEVQRVDLDGDKAEDLVASYASTRLGAENHLQLRLLRRTATGFESEALLREHSPFQTLEVRYLPGQAGARELHFRTFREERASCALFEVAVIYVLDRKTGRFVRGKESLRSVTPKALADEGEDVDAQCEKP